MALKRAGFTLADVRSDVLSPSRMHVTASSVTFCDIHCKAKKIAPFLFLCNNLLYFDNLFHTDTEANLQENCNKIAHLS